MTIKILTNQKPLHFYCLQGTRSDLEPSLGALNTVCKSNTELLYAIGFKIML